MKKYFIEVEEHKAETVIHLLAQINVKVGKSAEDKKHYIMFEDYGESNNFRCLTEEQFSLLQWLMENGYFADWEEIDPNNMFEEV